MKFYISLENPPNCKEKIYEPGEKFDNITVEEIERKFLNILELFKHIVTLIKPELFKKTI